MAVGGGGGGAGAGRSRASLGGPGFVCRRKPPWQALRRGAQTWFTQGGLPTPCHDRAHHLSSRCCGGGWAFMFSFTPLLFVFDSFCLGGALRGDSRPPHTRPGLDTDRTGQPANGLTRTTL
jgi:hypothetical protein